LLTLFKEVFSDCKEKQETHKSKWDIYLKRGYEVLKYLSSTAEPSHNYLIYFDLLNIDFIAKVKAVPLHATKALAVEEL
jgi:hypothetical protein